MNLKNRKQNWINHATDGPEPNEPRVECLPELHTEHSAGDTVFAPRIACILDPQYFLPIDMALSNIPYFTIMSFEIYRIIFSPFAENSILSLIFAIMIFYRMGKQMEWQHGSTGFMQLLGMIGLGTNLIFILVCFLLYFMNMAYALHMSCSGFWIIVFGLMVVDCMAVPEQPRKILFLPINIPSKYMPLALFGLFSLLGGFRLGDAIALGMGYLFSYGYLDKLKLTPDKLEQFETKYLGFLSSKPGFVTTHGATGDGSILPLNAPDGHPQQQQQQSSSFGSVFQTGAGGRQNSATGIPESGTTGVGGGAKRKDVFQGSARTLNSPGASQQSSSSSAFSVGRAFLGGGDSESSVKPSHSELQQRRLAALENRNALSQEPAATTPSAPPADVRQSDIHQIMEMGYSENDARRALELADGSLQTALNILTT